MIIKILSEQVLSTVRDAFYRHFFLHLSHPDTSTCYSPSAYKYTTTLALLPERAGNMGTNVELIPNARELRPEGHAHRIKCVENATKARVYVEYNTISAA